ncbi:MAG: chemotaxis-specific protein-glutamate methyltransferase CheB [Deltaproteobacteria bacterium]
MYNSSPENIKVLVIGQSYFTGQIIAKSLQSDSTLEVVDICRNNADIAKRINVCNPDVIAIDAQTQNTSEMEHIKKVLNNNFIPVVMLGKNEERYENIAKQDYRSAKTYFVNRQDDYLELISEPVKKELIKKVHMARNLKYNHIDNNSISFDDKIDTSNNTLHCNKFGWKYRNNFSKRLGIKNIIAIGTSTGGPKALLDVLPFIPKDLSAAYLIVQHMPVGFTASFAKRLDGLSEIRVKEAEDKDIVQAGTAYIAPGGYHMVVERNEYAGNLRIKLSDEPPKNSVRPSADILFNSLAKTDLDNLIGIVMTGMGCDGREGLINMKERNNAVIIAESEESCVVYGMPRAVINAGIADRIVPASQITNEIINYVGVDRNGYESVH